MTLRFRYSGIKEDGSSIVLCKGFDSKGKAFVSAAKSATKLRCSSNPNHFIRVEIQDYEGKPLLEYSDNNWLKCGTEGR